MRYAFIRAEHAAPYIRRFCDLFDVRPRGYYARLRQPRSNQDIAYTRLTGLIQPFWLETGGVYGYRKVYSDLLELGKVVVNRARRLMRMAGLRAQVGYRRPRHRSGPPNVVVPTCNWLVHEIQGHQETGPGCGVDGGIAAKSQSTRDGAFRAG